LSKIRSTQPFFEIGVGDDSRVQIYSFPDIPSDYEAQMEELKFDVRKPNIKDLVMKSALRLSLPIIGKLTIALRSSMLIVRLFDRLFI